MEAGKHLEEKNLNCELIRQIRKLEPTDHVALISSCREDELLALISFIELGLARGELCCVFAKRDLCLTIQAGLAGAEEAQAAGALVFYSDRQPLMSGKRCDPDSMFQTLESLASRARKGYFTAFRLVQDAAWLMGTTSDGIVPREEEGTLARYQSKLDHYIRRSETTALFNYCRNKFSEKALLATLGAHPFLIDGTVFCRNAYYRPAAKGSAEQGGRSLLDERIGLLHEMEALRRDSTRVETVLESMREAVFVRDEEKNIQYMNSAAEELTGWKFAEVWNRKCWEIFGNSSAGCARHCQESCQVDRDQENPFSQGDLVSRDGRLVRTRSANSPLMERDRKVGEIVVLEDVTELHQAEESVVQTVLQLRREIARHQKAQERIEARERELSTFLDSLPGYAFFKNSRSIYVSANRLYCEWVGCSPDEIRGKTDHDLFPEEVANQAGEEDRRIFETGESLDVGETRVRQGDRVLTISTRKVPVKNEKGRVVGVIGLGIDITQRKKAEADRERLVTAIEQLAEAIIITDTEGIIQYVNPAFEKITAFNREEAVGRNTSMLKSGEHDDAFYESLWETLWRGEIWQGNLINRRKDGALYEEEATIAPVRDGSGSITNYVAVKRDVTAQNELESQLQQAQRMVTVGQLAGGVAHDFNNLLTMINGHCEFLMNGIDPEDPMCTDVEGIRKASKQAQQLTRQLLTFSRRQYVEPKVLDLDSVLSEMKKMLKRLLGESIELRIEKPEKLGNIEADPGQVEHLIVNLAINSRDAMEEGGVLTFEMADVELDSRFARSRIDVTPGHFVRLIVSDTGCGMDENVRRHMFEPFFTTKGAGKGTGLGLATVYGIVKPSGGYIQCVSQADQGTTFLIYLPRVDKTAERLTGQDSEEKSVQGVETVLVVEDDRRILKLIQRALTKQGYVVVPASDGEAALEELEKAGDSIDLLLTDVVMPGMNGTELARRILELRPEMKVLFMSGYAGKALLHEIVEKVETEFIRKPFLLQSLCSRIRSILDGGPRAAGR